MHDTAYLGTIQIVEERLMLSTKTIRRWVDAGRIPGVVRLGRLVRFNMQILDQWIAAGCPTAATFRPKLQERKAL